MIDQAVANLINSIAEHLGIILTIIASLGGVLITLLFTEKQRRAREKYEDKIRLENKMTEFQKKLDLLLHNIRRASALSKPVLSEKVLEEFTEGSTLLELFGSKKTRKLLSELGVEIVSAMDEANIKKEKTGKYEINFDKVDITKAQLTLEIKKLIGQE